jgi:hypothetical protein
MVENANQKNMTIDLHIKMLQIKVTEHTPIYVIWQRGNDDISISVSHLFYELTLTTYNE